MYLVYSVFFVSIIPLLLLFGGQSASECHCEQYQRKEASTSGSLLLIWETSLLRPLTLRVKHTGLEPDCPGSNAASPFVSYMR